MACEHHLAPFYTPLVASAPTAAPDHPPERALSSTAVPSWAAATALTQLLEAQQSSDYAAWSGLAQGCTCMIN